MSKRKEIDPEVRIRLIEECLAGRMRGREAARRAGVSSTAMRKWINLYNSPFFLFTDAHLTFGEYRNVFLTEKEYKRLKSDFSGLDDLIEQLSAYIQSTGRKYADHAATLRIWTKRQKTEQKSTPGIPDYTFKKGESL